MIERAIFSGLGRTLRAWKPVLVIWFLSLLLTSLVAIPVKSSFKSVLGSSMITEKLTGGIIAEIIPDLGTTFGSLLSSFSAGLFFLFAVWFVINAFFTGGLFGSIGKGNEPFTLSEFFRKGSQNFTSFLVIMLVMSIMTFLIMVIFLFAPSLVAGLSESVSEKGVYQTIIVCGIIVSLFLIFLMTVTDYARAWQAGKSIRAPLGAIAFGFGQAFSIPSFLFMLLTVVIQLLPVILSYKIISTWVPDSAGGIFLFFLVSQSLFFIKIALRTWRYAGITILMEEKEAARKNAAAGETGVADDKSGIDYVI